MDITFAQNAFRNPGAIAIEDGSQKWTFSDLQHEVDRLSSILKSLELPTEAPIGILEGLGTAMIIAQLAVIRARLTCLPLDPSLPKARLRGLLEEVRVQYVLSNNESIGDELRLGIIPITGHHTDGGGARPHDQTDELDGGHNEVDSGYCSHILYTSGSSGKPKAVKIPESSILHLAFNTPVSLQKSDRVAVINNPGFDLSLFEILVSLISGSTLVIVPRHVITDPFTAREFIAEKKISIIFLTASLFSVISQACPNAFKDVQHVLTAGEVANMTAMQAVLESSGPPKNLWNTYGPTETAVFSTMHRVTLSEFQYDNISIGKPFGDTKLLLLDGQSNNITKPGQVGEILLGGPGLTPGYIGRPEENAARFFTSEDGTRYYRTGDLARWRPDAPGLLEFTGRADLQVKQGGFRVELNEIEQSLLSSKQLSGAIVLQICPPGDKEPFLVAFIIPAIANTVKKRQLVEYIEKKLPSYMIPKDFVFCSKYPITEHGKADRKALKERYLKKMEQLNTDRDRPNDKSHNTDGVIKSIWSSLLNVSEVKDADDFFLLNGTSIQAATMITKIRKELGKTISMRSLFENSRFRDLVNYLDEYAEGGNAPDDTKSWGSDAKLGDNLDTAPDWQDAKEGRVFMTGATGFIGAHFISRFLRMPTVNEVICLARPKGKVSGSERIQGALEKYDLWDKCSNSIAKLTVVSGDITLDQLGLAADKFEWLVETASVVFHLGAKLNFCEPYDAHRDVNVIGTKNVLEVALQGRRKAFHYMSSIDTWGTAGLTLETKRLLEDEPLDPYLPGLRYDTGYAASKWAAEAVVRQARRRGLPTVIYRPGFVIGDSRNGCGNPDDFFARLMVGTIQLGAFPHLPNQRMEYVTVDYVCDAALHIASNKKNLGKSFSLVAPNPADSVNLETTPAVINKAGYPVKTIPYWDWVQLLQQTNNENSPLMPLMPLLQEPVLAGLSRFETSRNTPHYTSFNTVAALEDAPDIRYVALDPAMLNRFLEFWDRKGFYNVHSNSIVDKVS
ncbi:hypothetical protein BDV23DRAFT_194855 [Aspergillus alliaceus]|uniref:Carrier domain-containing protein n=1 Tax=Petromyces alliaceus TaxID=209559 RepID=A0A5N7CLT8_PETAA|nr:hypothetical protein BDV23DRAFT_194855 [Aspergillus alliaceus]